MKPFEKISTNAMQCLARAVMLRERAACGGWTMESDRRIMRMWALQWKEIRAIMNRHVEWERGVA